MKTDGSGKFNVTDNSRAGDFEPSYSPSGKRIAYENNAKHSKINPTEIYTIKPDGSGKHQVTHNSREESSRPSWGSR
jgi:Tol biopolymer transport system component